MDKPRRRSRAEILEAVGTLLRLHEEGRLGGARMPKDANPGLPPSGKDNFLYFTLPMALNYQRNSYSLWIAALATWHDLETRFAFSPNEVCGVPENQLRAALLKHRLALQPVRHVAIWKTICATLAGEYGGDVRVLFRRCGNDIRLILKEVQEREKKGFPYLSGQKICNYWLYVMSQYTDADFRNRACLSVAPDTHVIQASIMLGVVDGSKAPDVLRPLVAEAWKDVLKGTRLDPIDIHTPLWLWSKRGFDPDI